MDCIASCKTYERLVGSKSPDTPDTTDTEDEDDDKEAAKEKRSSEQTAQASSAASEASVEKAPEADTVKIWRCLDLKCKFKHFGFREHCLKCHASAPPRALEQHPVIRRQAMQPKATPKQEVQQKCASRQCTWDA